MIIYIGYLYYIYEREREIKNERKKGGVSSIYGALSSSSSKAPTRLSQREGERRETKGESAIGYASFH